MIINTQKIKIHTITMRNHHHFPDRPPSLVQSVSSTSRVDSSIGKSHQVSQAFQLTNFSTHILSNSPTLLLSCSLTYLLTCSATFSTNEGSTFSSLVSIWRQQIWGGLKYSSGVFQQASMQAKLFRGRMQKSVQPRAQALPLYVSSLLLFSLTASCPLLICLCVYV